MNLWRRLLGPFLPSRPELPEPLSHKVLDYVADVGKERQRRVEREAAEQIARLAQIEERLRLYERTTETGEHAHESWRHVNDD